MDVKDRIEKVKEYFRGMQVYNDGGINIIYVIVQFPNRWIIDEEVPKKFGVTVTGGTDYQGQFYFCTEMEKGFDCVFDAIEYNINKMLSAQERATLFRQKTEELQNIFMDESIPLESLRNLEFSFKKTKQKSKKQIEVIADEIINNKPVEEDKDDE